MKCVATVVVFLCVYYYHLEEIVPTEELHCNGSYGVHMQVRNEWLKGPDITGEVTVTGLSVGEHHFTCSVGDHCQRGMRLTVTVESERRQASQDTEVNST